MILYIEKDFFLFLVWKEIIVIEKKKKNEKKSKKNLNFDDILMPLYIQFLFIYDSNPIRIYLLIFFCSETHVDRLWLKIYYNWIWKIATLIKYYVRFWKRFFVFCLLLYF